MARVTGAATSSLSHRAGDNIMHYTLPSLVEDLTVAVSYTPAGATDSSDSAFALTYAGVEGLSVKYGQGSNDGQAAGSGGTTTDHDTSSCKCIICLWFNNCCVLKQ